MRVEKKTKLLPIIINSVLGAAIKCKPYSEITVESGTHVKSVHFTSISNVEVTVKKCKSVYNYSTVLGAAIKCKPYSEITVESWTHLKTVKITLNIFAVWSLDIKINAVFVISAIAASY